MDVSVQVGRIWDADYSNDAMCLIWEKLNQASVPVCVIVEWVSPGKQITEVAFLLIQKFFLYL